MKKSSPRNKRSNVSWKRRNTRKNPRVSRKYSRKSRASRRYSRKSKTYKKKRGGALTQGQEEAKKRLQPLIDVLPELNQTIFEKVMGAVALPPENIDEALGKVFLDASERSRRAADFFEDRGIVADASINSEKLGEIKAACEYLLELVCENGGPLKKDLSEFLQPLTFRGYHINVLYNIIEHVRAAAQ